MDSPGRVVANGVGERLGVGVDVGELCWLMVVSPSAIASTRLPQRIVIEIKA